MLWASYFARGVVFSSPKVDAFFQTAGCTRWSIEKRADYDELLTTDHSSVRRGPVRSGFRVLGSGFWGFLVQPWTLKCNARCSTISENSWTQHIRELELPCHAIPLAARAEAHEKWQSNTYCMWMWMGCLYSGVKIGLKNKACKLP